VDTTSPAPAVSRTATCLHPGHTPDMQLHRSRKGPQPIESTAA
jgi:hypothetical protein